MLRWRSIRLLVALGFRGGRRLLDRLRLQTRVVEPERGDGVEPLPGELQLHGRSRLPTRRRDLEEDRRRRLRRRGRREAREGEEGER